MKKIIALILVMSLMLCMGGCGTSAEGTTTADNTTTYQTEIQAEMPVQNNSTEPQAVAISLVELDPYNTDGNLFYYNDSVEDIFGNVYASYLKPFIYGKNIYRISGNYTTFSGTLFVDSTNDEHSGDIKIYGDDVLLYSATVHGGEDPTSFSIDITGVRDLTVSMDGSDSYGYYGSAFHMGDPTLTP